MRECLIGNKIAILQRRTSNIVSTCPATKIYANLTNYICNNEGTSVFSLIRVGGSADRERPRGIFFPLLQIEIKFTY